MFLVNISHEAMNFA